MKARAWLLALVVLVALVILAACAPSTMPTQAPTAVTRETQTVVQTKVVEVQVTPVPTTSAPAETGEAVPTLAPTGLPAPTLTPAPATAAPSATAVTSVRVVELEWPPSMRLGDSDIVRVSLVPAENALVVTTEFEDHTTVTQTVPIPQYAGFDLAAVARLDAAGFEAAPTGDQVLALVAGQPATWRWTLRPLAAGQQRLAISVRLRWLPQPGNPLPQREAVLFDRGLTVQVRSFLGLTTRELSALGFAGLVFGTTLSVPLAAFALRPGRARRALLRLIETDPAVALETPPGLSLAPVEANLLRALFTGYGRLVIAAEFRSGYSGARTFLARPLRPDGRADA